MSFSICLETTFGPFIMNRHDRHQPMAIVRTGAPHIEAEIAKLLTIADALPHGAIAVDAGANIGLIAVPLAQTLQHKLGSVIAFEPQRLIYYMLAGNTALAGLQNLTCLQMALSDRAGEIHVPVLDPYSSQDFGTVSLVEERQAGEIVQALKLDQLGLERLDLIKIDVEHMELAVLNGAEATILRHRPFIWIEVWPQHYSNIHEWMVAREYNMRIVDELNFCAVPLERDHTFPLDLLEFDGANNPFAAEVGLTARADQGFVS